MNSGMHPPPRAAGAGCPRHECAGLGWHTHSPRIIQWVAGKTPMFYNTAISFVILGTALLGASRRQLSAALAILGGLLPLLTLFEYVAGVSLGIDELLMKSGDFSAFVSGANRPEHLRMPASAFTCGAVHEARQRISLANARKSPAGVGSLRYQRYPCGRIPHRIHHLWMGPAHSHGGPHVSRTYSRRGDSVISGSMSRLSC
jgi:hypothetical protein